MDGSHFISAGADGKVLMYEGKEGEKEKEFLGHTGSIYSLAWSPDNLRFVSGGADRTCKVWDVVSGTVLNWIYLGREQLRYGCSSGKSTTWCTLERRLVGISRSGWKYQLP